MFGGIHGITADVYGPHNLKLCLLSPIFSTVAARQAGVVRYGDPRIVHVFIHCVLPGCYIASTSCADDARANSREVCCDVKAGLC